jgi:hypothetical protein
MYDCDAVSATTESVIMGASASGSRARMRNGRKGKGDRFDLESEVRASEVVHDAHLALVFWSFIVSISWLEREDSSWSGGREGDNFIAIAEACAKHRGFRGDVGTVVSCSEA